MKKTICFVLGIIFFIVLGFMAIPKVTVKASVSSKQQEKTQSRFIVEKFQSTSLKNNMLNEITLRDLRIYLPPSYYSSKKRYPVVYFLHGYSEATDYIMTIQGKLDNQFIKNKDKEFILVEPDANNKLGGSFYVNSPVTGNWEDYIVKDIVKYVDSKYRTIPSAKSRGLSGFSMGGFGAFNLAFKHPDIFSATYIMSPGAFDKNGLKNAMGTWDVIFQLAYGAAFSPNKKISNPYANIPQFDNTKEDNKIIKDWENGFGNLKEKVKAYKMLNKPLTAIKIVCGTSDSYNWIMDGSKYLSKLLNDEGIKNEYETFNGDHEIEPAFSDWKLVDFFSKNLKAK